MPDITMCTNNMCPIMSKCYRHCATPNDHQSYSDFDWYMTDDEVETCDHFWEDDVVLPRAGKLNMFGNEMTPRSEFYRILANIHGRSEEGGEFGAVSRDILVLAGTVCTDGISAGQLHAKLIAECSYYTKAEQAVIDMYDGNNFIPCIKEYRRISEMGLRESKEAVEKLTGYKFGNKQNESTNI